MKIKKKKKKCANNASTSTVLDVRRAIGTNRATFSASPSKWESSCNAAVSSFQPLESTIVTNWGVVEVKVTQTMNRHNPLKV